MEHLIAFLIAVNHHRLPNHHYAKFPAMQYRVEYRVVPPPPVTPK